MEDFEIESKLKDAIFRDGIQPDIVTDGGFLVDDISNVTIEKTTPGCVSGSCTIEATSSDIGEISIHGKYRITTEDGNEEVCFEDFSFEQE